MGVVGEHILSCRVGSDDSATRTYFVLVIKSHKMDRGTAHRHCVSPSDSIEGYGNFRKVFTERWGGHVGALRCGSAVRKSQPRS